MAAYGTQPKQVTSCTCYNLENTHDGISHFDMTGAQCGRFTKEHECNGTCSCKEKDPIQEAIDYLKSQNLDFEKLDETQKKHIDEFITELEKNQQLKTTQGLQQNIINSIE
jgi:hypothetical protein